MKNKLKITTINDEISDDLNETIEFLKACRIKYVELKTTEKKNLIDYSLAEVKNIRETLTNIFFLLIQEKPLRKELDLSIG